MSSEAKEDALSITNDVKKATPTRKQPKRMPKSVTTDSVKEGTSDLITISNKGLKQNDVKLKKENIAMKRRNEELKCAASNLKKVLHVLKSEKNSNEEKMKLQSYVLEGEQSKNVKLYETQRDERRSRDGSMGNKKASSVAKASRSDLKTMISYTK